MRILTRQRYADRLPRFRERARRVGSCESGATAIEYGLLAGVMALAVITAMTAFGTGLTATYDTIAHLATRMTLDP